jgi:hypothetical protein
MLAHNVANGRVHPFANNQNCGGARPHTTSRIWEYQHARRLRVSKLSLFMTQYATMRLIGVRRRAQMTPARLDGG